MVIINDSLTMERGKNGKVLDFNYIIMSKVCKLVSLPSPAIIYGHAFFICSPLCQPSQLIKTSSKNSPAGCFQQIMGEKKTNWEGF